MAINNKSKKKEFGKMRKWKSCKHQWQTNFYICYDLISLHNALEKYAVYVKGQ